MPARDVALTVGWFVAAALAAVGCGRHAQHKADAAGPASGYRAELRAIVNLETEALAAVADHTGPKYTDDAALLAALRETALPRYRDYVARLASIRPPAGPLTSLHERLLRSATAELALLEKLEAAVASGDATVVLKLNQEQRRIGEETDALVGDLAAAMAAGAARR